MGDVKELSAKPLGDLKLSPPVASALKSIQADLADAYREGFLQMTETLQQTVSALSRIQTTLNILVEHLSPTLKDKVPMGIQMVSAGEKPDLARALVVADPIGAGYVLSQADLAKALRLSQPDVSILVRAFDLSADGQCAIVVRQGTRKIVNYHPRAVDRFKDLVASQPKGLEVAQKRAIERVKKKLIKT
jgi:hypothetical protein